MDQSTKGNKQSKKIIRQKEKEVKMFAYIMDVKRDDECDKKSVAMGMIGNLNKGIIRYMFYTRVLEMQQYHIIHSLENLGWPSTMILTT